jgi:hypothetical protein
MWCVTTDGHLLTPRAAMQAGLNKQQTQQTSSLSLSNVDVRSRHNLTDSNSIPHTAPCFFILTASLTYQELGRCWLGTPESESSSHTGCVESFAY